MIVLDVSAAGPGGAGRPGPQSSARWAFDPIRNGSDSARATIFPLRRIVCAAKREDSLTNPTPQTRRICFVLFVEQKRKRREQGPCASGQTRLAAEGQREATSMRAPSSGPSSCSRVTPGEPDRRSSSPTRARFGNMWGRGARRRHARGHRSRSPLIRVRKSG